MIEIYFLQRIANIASIFGVAFWVIVIVGTVASVIIITYCCSNDFDFDEDQKKAMQRIKQYAKYVLYCFIVVTLGAVFTPTDKDLLVIYGVGGTIDYIKSNDKAKELPDKVVDALTRYVDSIEKENKQQE